MRKVTGMAIIILSGLLNQVKAQDFRPGKSSSIRLSQSFVRAESDFSMLTVLGYRYQIAETIRIGADLGYHGRTYSRNRINEFAAAASTDFTYSKGRAIEFYGTVSVGYRIHTGKFDYADKPVSQEMKGARGQ
ncbi:hypothetical protein [Pedobacter sp. NJ-S-72]